MEKLNFACDLFPSNSLRKRANRCSIFRLSIIGDIQYSFARLTDAKTNILLQTHGFNKSRIF